MVVRKSKVKELVGPDFRISADFYDALNNYVQTTLTEAKNRAYQHAKEGLGEDLVRPESGQPHPCDQQQQISVPEERGAVG